MLKFLLYIIVIFAAAACSGRGRPDVAAAGAASDSATVEYARGFTIEKRGEVTLLTVSNPWQGARDVVYRYALCPKGAVVPAEFADYAVVRTPVERVICMSTTHIAMLAALGRGHSIRALSGAAFVSDSAVREAVARGTVVDVGYEDGLSYEKIISISPDVIFAYGVGGEASGSMRRLAGLGQTVVFNAEYLEQTVLGKAEWLKFMAAFYGLEREADVLFGQIRDEYLRLCLLARDVELRPRVICGLPWQGIWHVPGGRSWMAEMIADAGGDYAGRLNDSRESVPINIETVVQQGDAADFWINTGAARTLDEVIAVDKRLSLIRPFRSGAVYNNSARASLHGGNDFFESGAVNPQLILKDLIGIFHPELLNGYELYYYMNLR